MKKIFFLLLITIISFNCNDEATPTNPTIVGCLQDLTLVEENESCNSRNPFMSCEFSSPTPFEIKTLSQTMKANFIDFCNEINDELIFENTAGERMVAKITDKKYQTEGSVLVSGYDLFNLDSCRSNCLAGEEAFIDFSAQTFSFRLGLVTNIRGDVFDVENPAQSIRTGFKVWRHPGSSSFELYFEIFSVNLENNIDSSIFPDTTHVRYHENIMLNNQNYSGLYSNENYTAHQGGISSNPNPPPPREKIYFHPEDGLIAVRDSLGELWIKN